MLCDMASGQNPFGAWLCSRCVRTRVKIERIARSATPFNPWTSGGWRRLDLVDAVLVEQVLNGVREKLKGPVRQEGSHLGDAALAMCG